GVASSQREGAPSGYTLGFVAPEIVEGRGFDGRADLYSLGMSLLALRDRGKPPTSEVTVKVRPLGLTSLFPLAPIETMHLPPALKTIVERLVRIDPSERFGSAAQVIEAIAAASGRPVPLETAATRVGWVGSARLAGRDVERARLESRWAEVQRGGARHVA